MADDCVMQNGFDYILENIKSMRQIYKSRLDEGFIGNHRGDLERQFDDLEERIIKARRILGKLNAADLPPEEVSAQKSRIMREINYFRQKLHAVMKELGMSDREMAYHLDRISQDRAYGKPSEVFSRVGDSRDAKDASIANRIRNTGDIERASTFKPKKKSWFNFGRFR